MTLDARAMEAQRDRIIKALDELVQAYDGTEDGESRVFLKNMAKRRLERALEDARQMLAYNKRQVAPAGAGPR